MRATRIPPKLEQPRTTAGLPVGPRELVIVGPACVLAVLTFFSGLPFFVKVGVAVGLVGLAAAYAMVRLEGRFTIEAYLFNRLGYAQRVHRRTRGGAGPASASPRLERSGRRVSVSWAATYRRAWFTIPGERVPSNQAMVANAVGLALLSMFVAWLESGGLNELMLLRSNILYLR